MKREFVRTAQLLGAAALEKLENARVAVFGIGGVGGYVAEALARSGVGKLLLVDNDVVSLSNINRQIIALHSTLGMSKTQAMKARILDINPAAEVQTLEMFYTPETADSVDLSGYDFVIDAVDTVAAKTELAVRSLAVGVKIISAMGAGNKTDPCAFRVADISKTTVCPLARAVRRELRKRGIETGVTAVFSVEESLPGIDKDGIKSAQNVRALPDELIETKGVAGRKAPASVAYMPSIMGLIISAEAIKELTR